MERQKIHRLVITFPTTTAAMMMESACGAGQGRLIPIPREISAGCGLAWCAEPQQEADLLSIMDQNQIVYQAVRVIEMF